MFLSKHRISLSESQEHKKRLRIIKITLTAIVLSLFSTYLISLVISDMNSKKIKETYQNLNGLEEKNQEMLDLVYRGKDQRKNPYIIKAKKGIRNFPLQNQTYLEVINAEMILENDKWSLNANSGIYFEAENRLFLNELTKLESENGHNFTAEEAEIFTEIQKASLYKSVKSFIKQKDGTEITINSDKLFIDNNKSVATYKGSVESLIKRTDGTEIIIDSNELFLDNSNATATYRGSVKSFTKQKDGTEITIDSDELFLDHNKSLAIYNGQTTAKSKGYNLTGQKLIINKSPDRSKKGYQNKDIILFGENIEKDYRYGKIKRAKLLTPENEILESNWATYEKGEEVFHMYGDVKIQTLKKLSFSNWASYNQNLNLIEGGGNVILIQEQDFATGNRFFVDRNTGLSTLEGNKEENGNNEYATSILN